ncbi:MAG: UPF0175 family protein [Caldilinea sp.]|nr:UPF0175 family protein [Caldilinea sp.]MCB9116957.1 UPF0175 family protein [Caldilineaceae bacterium]MCO5211982.1 UPF0175 family protein [Caldilinea sp.]MCW5841782.1 UPF0175 family protein [Caldilinea sp.]
MAQTVTLALEIPSDLAALLGGREQATEVVKEHVILGLYLENRISGGKAAELLGLTRHGFLALLTRKGLDYFRLTEDEWQQEATAVKLWADRRE